jgi:hypothetical protein
MVGLALALIVLVLWSAWTAAVLRWARRATGRDRYFRRPLAERRALKARIGWLGRTVRPLLSLFAPLLRKRIFLMEPYQGFTGPGAICSPATFAAAQRHRPGPEDVFVATQMKCGTTWMQQMVYEAVSRGKGDLGDEGHRHLYAISPWIESTASVSMEDAPLVGARPTRIIKTHLPTELCPYDERARYVYVLRHPVSCFASCVDFMHAGMGLAAPDRAGLLDWFCSDEMWWGPWPDHADGWWRWSDRDNVLFLHYEDMKRDLAGAVRRVSDHLGLDLDPGELAAVTEKSDYGWMKRHEERFEMHAPSLLGQEGGVFMKSGAADRHADAAEAEAERIRRFCRERLAGKAYPLARFYPDVAAESGP